MINIIIDKQGRPSKSSIFLGNQHENLDETLQFFFPKEYEDHYRYIAYCYKDRRTGKKITGISPLVEDAFKVTSAITKCAGMWQLYVICKTTQIDEKATIIDLTANNSTGEHIFISDAINGRISGNEIDIEAFENIAVDENIKILYDEILSLKLRVEKNEETRQSQENTRQTAETNRANAENERVIAEQSRSDNEVHRTQSEESRVTAESKRVEVEKARVKSETLRGQSENARVNAENIRAEAEKSRVNAEGGRVSAENERVKSETLRKQSEQTRSNEESTRQSAERTRVSEESTRKNAENARVSAEQSRVSVESQRVSAETNRANAERLRSEAETNRINAEQSRADAEQLRVSAENERVTAETARQEAENKRDDVINDLRESVDRKITKFYASNQGETHITDSDNGKIQDMLIYGKSEQFTTTGKNLLKIKDGEQTTRGVTVTAKNGVIQLKGTATETGCAILEIDPITLSGTYITSNNYSDTIKVTLANASYQSVLEQNKPNVLENEEITKICFTVSSGKSYDISNILIQLEKSSSATAYEPYTGGIPSPSPNYPQDIKSVVNPTIKLIGANLLKLEFVENENNGITLEVVGNKLRFHGTITDTYTFFRLKNKPLIKKGTKVSLYADNHDGHTAFMRLDKTSDGTFDSLNKDNPSDTLSEDKYLNAIGIGRYNVGDTIDFTTTFAVLDSTDIYKPYMEQSITLPITLNAVPVPSDGNVTIDGKQYIADYIDVESGKIVRRTKRVDLKDVSAQTNLSYGTHTNGIGYLAYSISNSSNETTIKDIAPVSNKYIGSRWTDESGYVYIPSARSIIFVDSRFVDRPTAISLIKDVYVIYATNTSNEEDLTVEQIKALKAFKTYYPTTNISTNSEQLEGYTTFNYSISMANGWNYVKQQLNDNRDYIYDVDMQSSEAYVNSEYVTALTELGV